VTALAVLPIKRLDAAKGRLGPTVSAQARRALAAAMAADVLDALGRVGGLAGVIAVTGESEVARTAAAAGAETVEDARDAGQSAAAQLGVARALARGARHALLVPGDCPALDPAEVEALLAGVVAGASVAVIPDRHGTGTNGLLLTPPDVIAPAFGPNSFDRHVEAARRAGAAVHVERLPSLALDVDTAGDLVALRAALAESPAVAPRTRGVLAGVPSDPP
jgi:2-phospho-L-lactate/phosphoenolpyruvate guanylyltransferase